MDQLRFLGLWPELDLPTQLWQLSHLRKSLLRMRFQLQTFWGLLQGLWRYLWRRKSSFLCPPSWRNWVFSIWREIRWQLGSLCGLQVSFFISSWYFLSFLNCSIIFWSFLFQLKIPASCVTLSSPTAATTTAFGTRTSSARIAGWMSKTAPYWFGWDQKTGPAYPTWRSAQCPTITML